MELSAFNFFFVTADLTIAFMAIIGNFFILILFIRNRKLRVKRNYYLISLAFANILLAVLGVPFSILVSHKIEA